MVNTPDVNPKGPTAQYTDSIGKYIVIYLCILVIAALQFVIAYQNIDKTQTFARMLFLALVEGGFALLFFMHLWAEKRGFLLFVAIFTGFVLLAMQYSWSDSYRMDTGVPYAQPKIGVVK
jgi:heme/copper-type cytochrome/quinol oxidase subunit 4